MNSDKNKKTCTKCNQEKDISLFNKYQRSKDGYKSICKECQSIYNKTRYEKTKQGPSTRDLIELTLDKMKIGMDDVDEFTRLYERLGELNNNLKIENKVTDDNSFIMPKPANQSETNLKADITLKLLNAGILVGANDIFVVKRENEYLIQMDNVHMTPQQKASLTQ